MRIYYLVSNHEDLSYRYEFAWNTMFGPAPTPLEIFAESGYQWPMTLHWVRCEECGTIKTGQTPETIEHCPHCCNCYECGESQF